MKIICVPLTLNAMRLLDTNDRPDSLLEIIHLADEEYKKFLISGAVETINKTLGKMINDYEDEIINTNEDLSKALAIFKDHLTPKNSSVMKN
ncbi:hypothetical protein FBY10_10593 [Pseudomonas sp. SJZ103]|uniref:hypothetical protein n=1 Tax=unclassified Pseudomonas TaxID=196821 RepID=UPI0011ADD9B0|nr:MULTISPECIES: hypothetical protein [unclassified Pseudomonas]MCS4315336.1 hypothetical protein [Pseudomonas sp. BIGb0381]TWC70045.1 hypothetical protein FBY10_10593 [Pseudomonas sp. SJZ103]TWC87544.1 hypothetical protein FBY08_104286 [Pseudomonas sp. SJZ094]